MQFEAKSNGGIATSQAAGLPWASMTIDDSQDNCEALGSKYDLISNPEWITIAREIENNSVNWSSGVVGTGRIPVGHSDSSPSQILAVNSTADPYDQTLNSSADPLNGVGAASNTYSR